MVLIGLIVLAQAVENRLCAAVVEAGDDVKDLHLVCQQPANPKATDLPQ